MDDDRRPFWDQAMWTEDEERENERRQQERQDIIIRVTRELPQILFPGPTPMITQH